MPSAEEVEFGKLVIEHQLASSDQIRECFNILASTPQIHIGQFLLQRGVINQAQAQQFIQLAQQRAATSTESQDIRLGQQLLSQNLISQAALSELFQECQQRRAHGQQVELSTLLVQRGLLSPQQLQSLGIIGAPASPSLISSHATNMGIPPNQPNPLPAGYPGAPQSPAPIQGFQTPHSGAPSGSDSQPNLEGKFRENDPLLRKFSASATPTGEPFIDFGQYEVLEEVARGGMGIVYRARIKNSDKIVAIKAMKSGDSASEKQVRRFVQETEATQKLTHENIVGIHEVGCIEGLHFYTMDLVEGGALDIQLKNGQFPTIEKAAKILVDVSLPIQHAHDKKIIHRDLKPANILFDSEGQAKVTDFGLAKSVDRRSTLTRTGAVVGTPYYMPPEQARGNTDIDARCDVYSLGIILYELVAGRPPFRGDTAMEIYQKILEDEAIPPSEVNQDVTHDLETIILKAIEKRRERRYQTAKELAEDLQRFISKKPIVARRSGLKESLQDYFEERRGLLIGIVVTTLVITIASLAGTYQYSKTQTAKRFKSRASTFNEYRAIEKQEQRKVVELLNNFDRDKWVNPDNASISRFLFVVNETKKVLGKLDGALAAAQESENRDLISFYVLTKDARLRDLLFEDKALKPQIDYDQVRTTVSKLAPLYNIELQTWTNSQIDYLSAALVKATANPFKELEEAVEFRLNTPTKFVGFNSYLAEYYLQRGWLYTHKQALNKFAKNKTEAVDPLKELEKAEKFTQQKTLLARIHFARGQFFRFSKQPKKAVEEFSRGIDIQPDYPRLFLYRGRSHRNLGNTKAAADDFKHLIEKSSQQWKFLGHLELGKLNAATADPENAKKDLIQAQELAPSDYRSYLELAKIQHKQNNLSRATEGYREAIARDPGCAEALLAILKIEKSQNQDVALKAFDQKARNLLQQKVLLKLKLREVYGLVKALNTYFSSQNSSNLAQFYKNQFKRVSTLWDQRRDADFVQE